MLVSVLIEGFGVYSFLLAVSLAALLVFYQYRAPNENHQNDVFKFEIDPVASDFDWETEDPIPYRPFKKGPYNLTMGLKNLGQDEWLLLEKTYLNSTNERAEIVSDPKTTKHTVLVTPEAVESLCELYDITLNYLQQKYPMYFYIDKSESKLMINAIRKESI